ncbi:hypothetical protein B0J18DRAFT_53872 [Chaetomium sp. MPI-SDFR-AT-0129]|nr:hypothetical protein B0J18DRAFT_53872 [Chaetomium sp. MPI-SDFR-AT-0129]
MSPLHASRFMLHAHKSIHPHPIISSPHFRPISHRHTTTESCRREAASQGNEATKRVNCMDPSIPSRLLVLLFLRQGKVLLQLRQVHVVLFIQDSTAQHASTCVHTTHPPAEEQGRAGPFTRACYSNSQPWKEKRTKKTCHWFWTLNPIPSVVKSGSNTEYACSVNIQINRGVKAPRKQNNSEQHSTTQQKRTQVRPGQTTPSRGGAGGRACAGTEVRALCFQHSTFRRPLRRPTASPRCVCSRSTMSCSRAAGQGSRAGLIHDSPTRRLADSLQLRDYASGPAGNKTQA